MGVGTSPAELAFILCGNPEDLLALRNGRFSPNVVTKRSSVSRRGIQKDIFETFHFSGHLPPKSKIENQTGTSLRAACYRSRNALFTPRCSPRARELPRSGQLFLRHTVAKLRGVKVAKFSDFGLFSLYKTPKTHLPVTSQQPSGYIAEWFRFSHVVVEGPIQRDAFQYRRFSATSVKGAGNPQTCPNFRLWQMAIPIHNATTRVVSDLDQRCLRTNVLSHQISLHLPPISPQNPILGDVLMRNLLYREPSVSRTLTELWRWNFTVVQL